MTKTLLHIGCLVLLCGCTQWQSREGATDEPPFRNMSAEYVGDDACFDCHEDEWRGFQDHGMANSMYPLTADQVVETFPSGPIYHEGGDLYYRAFREGDRFFQEEYRLSDGGDTTHSLIREMEMVVGSGTAARTYLTEKNNRYYELPLTWYTQEERWAFSPGYEASRLRFNRTIPDRCMSCHNSYPEPVAFADGMYLDVPHGIGCERCHGPGSLHIDARLASPEPADSIDETIVNPAHLSLDRRLDVCQQCHLSATVSILREGRSAYDFRPSQRLSEHVALFASTGDDDELDVISHADRMKQSPCFIETQSWDQPMDCVTCHDPHEGFRAAGPSYFDNTCRSCHAVDELQDAMPTLQTRAVHTDTSNCFSCHMPKYEGTPHASFTDHMIRVVEETPDGPSTEAVNVELRPYFADEEDSDIYRGMAYIVYGRQQGDSTAMRRGIKLLEDHVDEEHGEAQFLLGFAYLQLREYQRAVEPLETAILSDAGIPERLNALAQAYEATGRSASSIERLYERALSIQPALSEVRTNYGRFLESQGRLDEAMSQYRQAIEAEPWLETAHYNLGTALLRAGEFEAAEESLRDAIRLEPDYTDALSNLGLLLASQNREAEAQEYFERALDVSPTSPVALGNLGAFHLNAGSLEESVRLLSRAVEEDPNYVDGLVNLALAYFRLEEYDRARTYAQRALQLDPQNQLAQQILGAT